jgi:tRNA-splicing ligase RtcB
MANASALPVAVAGALMPDAHVGYGLPIGGVLATDNAVIPYAVGVDIACRMKLTVYDCQANTLAGQRDRFANLIESETRFGMGCEYKQRRNHDRLKYSIEGNPIHRVKCEAAPVSFVILISASVVYALAIRRCRCSIAMFRSRGQDSR